MVDPKCENYSVPRITRRWLLTIFFQLFNIAGINENILYNNTCIEKNIKLSVVSKIIFDKFE